MTKSKKPEKPSSTPGATKACDSAVEPCPLEKNKFKITKIEVKSDAVDNKIFVNIPEHQCVVTALVTYIKTKDDADLDSLPDTVVFTFNDPGDNNTVKADSFYDSVSSKFLGKKSDPTAIYWQQHAGYSASSDNSFKLNAKVLTKTVTADSTMEAKVYFKPSGVGGNDYKITAKVYKADGTTELVSADSSTFVIWRSINLDGYQMDGQTSIDTHGSTASMAAYYTASTFVKYELGTVTAIPAAKSVKYIGLWDTGTSAMLVWSTLSAKTAAETPSNDQKTKANGPAGADQTTERAAIQAKADAWKSRIIAKYNSGLNNWASDAGIPTNTLIAIEFEHPKYSNAAPNSDSVTSEWTDYPWLTINVEGTVIHPDSRWIRGQGVAFGNRAYITAGMSAARTKVVVAHEAGHETKNQFKRKPFGGGDHSSTSGLMDPTGSRSAFTAGEKKILRGFG